MKLIHELEVHQIELEMQNEELMLARSAALEEAEKYTELYDFAPSGYFTLSKECKIVDINLFGSQMLGKERSKLKNSRFDVFISNETKPIFSLFFEKVFESKTKETCEVALSTEGKLLTYVILSGIIDKDPEYCLLTAVDITKRRHAEEKVVKIGKHYLALIEKAPDGIALINSEGKFKFVSLSSRRIFGYNDAEEITDDSSKYTHPDDLHLVLAELDKLIKEPSYVPTLQYRFACKDGSYRWIESTFSNLLADPDVEAIVINFRDITERRQVENELRESRQMIEGIINAIPARVFWKDRNLVFLGCNLAFARDAGFSDPGDLIGKDDFQMGWHDQANMYRSDDRQVIESGCAKLNIEEHQSTPEGNSIFILTSKVPLIDFNGMISGVIGTYVDITELRKIAKALQESEEKYRLIFEYSPVGILSFDENGVIVTCNDKFGQIIGSSLENLIGLNMLDLPDKKLVASVQRSLNGNTGLYEDVYRSVTAKKITPVRILFAPVVFESGYIRGGIGIVEDITERKQAEETLRLKEQRYRSFIDSTTDYVFLKDEQFKHLVVNKSYSSSYNMTEKEILGKTDFELMPEPFASNCLISDKKTIETNGLVITEEIWGDKTFETVKFPVEYQKGKIGVGGFVRDISERRKAEKARIETEEKYRNIVKWAPVGIYQTTNDGEFLTVNQQLAELLGYESVDDLMSRNIETDIYLFPSERQKAIDYFGLAGYVFNHEIQWKKKDGTPIWISLSTHVIKDQAGAIQYFEGFVSDITERKQTEEILRISEKKFRNIFENSLAGISLTTIEGKMTVNNAFCHMTGYIEDELEHSARQAITHPDDLEKDQEVINDIVTGKKKTERWEKRYIRKDGTILWADMFTILQRDNEENPLYFLTTIVDITDYKHAEEVLKKNLDEMRRFHRLTVGRELTMIEIKKEVNELLRKNGEAEKYRIVE